MTTTDTPTKEPAPPVLGRSVVRRVRDAARQAYATLLDEALLVTVLVGSYLVRWLLADRNSYWLDELHSVAVHGIWNDSATAAVDRLASTSVHPPLYQFILYHWMELFGDGERATRSLSNLYITLATLLLYLLLRAVFTRRVALASAIAFTLMYVPIYYGMETRSYAQTLFLVTLSSYALLRLMRTGAAGGWRPVLRSPAALLFMVANVALLLTHYYNAFFWVAQGILAGVFVLRERPARSWPAGLGTVAAMYALQGGLFVLIWGRVLAGDYDRRAGDFPTDGGVRGPLHLLETVAGQNLYHTYPAPLLRWVGLAVVVAMAGWVVAGLARSRGPTIERNRAWTVAYLTGWLLVPLLVVYAAFVATGVARYYPRYWLFVMPTMAPLLILACEQAMRLAGQTWRRMRGSTLHSGWATVTAVVAVATLIVPGTLEAATRTKADFRGTARNIVNIIESNPEASYAVYDTSFNSTSVLDYYLARYSDHVHVAATIPRFEEEAQAGGFTFERGAGAIEGQDFLIVAFVHQGIEFFPLALQRLQASYPVYLWLLDEQGKGLVIFSLP